jgi:hypothetical protein
MPTHDDNCATHFSPHDNSSNDHTPNVSSAHYRSTNDHHATTTTTQDWIH